MRTVTQKMMVAVLERLTELATERVEYAVLNKTTRIHRNHSQDIQTLTRIMVYLIGRMGR